MVQAPCFLLACIVAFASRGLLGDDHFKTLDNTTSPDGAYVFAYGPVAPADKLGLLTEAAKGDDSVAKKFQPNYLVDARTRKIWAAIPLLHDMELNLASPHSSFGVAWSPDGKSALAIFNGRYSSDTMMWIDPAARRFTDVTVQLADPLRRLVLERNGEKLADMLSSLWFGHTVIRGSGVLILTGSAADLGGGGSGLTFEYALRYQVSHEHDNVHLKLLKWEVMEEGEIPANELEPALNEAYTKARAVLDPKARDALTQEELAWLKKREAITNESEKNGFTTSRIKQLRARLVE